MVPPGPTPPESIRSSERASLEARLAVAEKKLERTLPLYLKFERGEPNLEAEEQLQPLLDEIFNDTEYSLECRGMVCQIDSQSNDGWRRTLQTAPSLAGRFKSMMVGRSVAVELDDAAQAHLIQTALAPVHALFASEEFERCKQSTPDTGTLAMSVQIESSRFHVTASGPLSDRPVGRCILKLFEEIANSTTIPPGVISGPLVPFPVPVP